MNHLAEAMHGLQVESLRFTVYKRGSDGGIIELINTGMVGIRRFSQQQRITTEVGGHDAVDSSEIVMDFENNVRMRIVTLREILCVRSWLAPLHALRWAVCLLLLMFVV